MVRLVINKNFFISIFHVFIFMVLLNTSIVNGSLPSIYKGLDNACKSSLQWVVTAYTLAFGGFLLLGGRAADLYGRKRVFLSAVALFTLMSLLCGAAQSSSQLNALRAMQGLAAAFMSPAALSIIITTFT